MVDIIYSYINLQFVIKNQLNYFSVEQKVLDLEDKVEALKELISS